ncbi:hypothetical protein D3C81_1854690 [compost metagenome]
MLQHFPKLRQRNTNNIIYAAPVLIQTQHTALNPDHAKQIADQSVHPASSFANGKQQLPPVIRTEEVFTFQQTCNRTDNCSKRCPKLMR